MKKTMKYTALTVVAMTAQAHATVLVTDVQSGLMGETVPFSIDGLTTDTGSTRSQFGGGFANLTDGNSATFGVNLTGTNTPTDLGWIGIRFNNPQDNVIRLEFDAQIFGDGGWFNGGSVLDGAGNGVEPTIQFTTSADAGTWGENQFVSNGDNIWTTIASTSDYPTGLNAQTLAQANAGGVALGQTFTFDFAEIDNVTAIRVIGSMGGNTPAGDTFIAAQEVRAFTAAVPEPSSAALLGLGGLALILRRRK